MEHSHLINPQLGHKSHNSSGDAGFSRLFQPSSASIFVLFGVLPSVWWSSSLRVLTLTTVVNLFKLDGAQTVEEKNRFR